MPASHGQLIRCIPASKFALADTRQLATPFSLMFGREVRLPIDLMFDTPPGYPSPSSTSRYAQTLRKYLQEAYHFVREHTKSRQLRQKELCDRRIGGNPYQVHDRVWLHCPAVPKGRARKFHRPWQGPFRVVTVLSDAVYRIQREGSRQRKVVHFDRLKPYHGPQMEEGEEATQTDRETHSRQVFPQQMELGNEFDEWEIVGTEPLTVEAETEESVTEAAEPKPPSAVPPIRCSQRNRCPPQRYGFDEVYV